jgi:Met-zincin/Domain of unknown function (DUF5117)/Domain of unknown function (DUF5118)
MTRYFKCASIVLALCFVNVNAFSQRKGKNDKTKPVAAAGATDDKKPKPYKDVITAKAVTKKGMITVHKIDEKWFFEIADTMLNREIMSVTRYAKTPAGCGNYGGEMVNSQVIRFEKGPGTKMFIRSITYVTTSADSTKPMFQAVKNSNVDPIIGSFDIKALKKDTCYVIDVSEYFNSENQAFTMAPWMKQNMKLSTFQKERSYIQKISTFPLNTEIKTVKTFDAIAPTMTTPGTFIPAGMDAGAVTMEFNISMVLLPKVPMRKRYFDQRVGFFANGITVYGEESKNVENEVFALRWRLEPKNAADAEKQKRGELIEPKKQIVYYIDPATPVKWRKYLKMGVDDWNVAFEAAGWKNAIKGEYWPENDTTMSLEDARYSVIRYFASDIQNAYGPNVHDPRSGEILESHIGWYHNIMRLLHDWYMVQAAAVDPKARKNEFDDELMGKLVRFVSSHEVGHTLGLRHNMGASSATPVEMLRNKEYCEKNGHTSSIMDYARFNYVAQPEDGVTDLYPRIGDYDKWAIQWGYSYFKDAKSAEEEKVTLNALTKEKVKNPRCQFGTEMSPCDPRFQTEDLSDNAVKASEYGLKNLQRIMPKLLEWTREDGESYKELSIMYGEVVDQFRQYIKHVSKYIGGIYDTPKTYDMEGDVYAVVPKELQKASLNFLMANVFTTPTWMMDQAIYSKIKPESGVEAVKSLQINALNMIMAEDKAVRLMETAPLKAGNYSLEEFMTDLRNGICAEFKTPKAIDIYRRNLQKAYLTKLIAQLNPEPIFMLSIPPGAGYDFEGRQVHLKTTDLPSLVRANLEAMRADIKATLAITTDKLTKAHLQDMVQRIELALNPR